jgi:methylenetetrahydrofolate dehydrogenase (NADP+)/methenyltetrahydrofolate cyclohydrolase
MASLLLNADATVEICHIFTDDLKKHTLDADIVLVGVGVINLKLLILDIYIHLE